MTNVLRNKAGKGAQWTADILNDGRCFVGQLTVTPSQNGGVTLRVKDESGNIVKTETWDTSGVGDDAAHEFVN